MVNGTAAMLAGVVRERARILGPALLVGMAFFVAAGESMGVARTAPVFEISVVLVVVLGVLTAVLALGRVPDRWCHVISTLMWWCPVGATLLNQYFNYELSLSLLLMVLIASAGTLLDTRLVVGSLLAVSAIAIPTFVREGGSDTVMLVSIVLTAELFALLIHVLMRRALVRAETHRLAEAETARELAVQLAELQRSEDERKALQHQLIHAQRMEATGTLAAGLAHDMNNVLASITSFAELLTGELGEQRSAGDVAQIIAQAARGAELTRGLLAFSRRGQYRKQILVLDDVVRDVIPILSRTLPKTIELRTTLGAETCIEGDPAHVGQVLVNFGLNAAHAMDGKGSLAIVTDTVMLDLAGARALALEPGKYARIRVTDSGAGMDEVTRLRVFEPFFTTKPLGKGTGLGLSTVWGIVQSHGGMVKVDSELGRGTTFCVHLPITNATPAPLAMTAPGIERIHAATVLVVDDEPAVREGTARLLERSGICVLTASDGAEALRIFDQHSVSIGLVILDMGMPVMSGAECFGHLRERSAVPVLVSTGYAIEAEAQALIARGATLIEKPFRSKELTREVSRLLQNI